MWKNSRLESIALATADRETTDREPESRRGPVPPALPNARLNPLQNPLLAKQLGRWAHIYYTASVDKREAAIEKLVCELEAEEARLHGTAPTPHTTSAPDAAAPRTQGPVLVGSPKPDMLPAELPVAELPAELPHDALLEDTGRNDRSRIVFAKTVVHETVMVQPEVPEKEESVENVTLSPAPASWQELLRQSDSAPAAQTNALVDQQPRETHSLIFEPAALPADVPEIDPAAAEDYRSYSDLVAKSDAARADAAQAVPTPAHRWRLALIAAGILAILGGLFWLRQFSASQVANVQLRHAPVGPPHAALKPPAPPVVVAEAPVAKPTFVPSARDTGPTALTGAAAKSADGTPPPDPELTAGMRSLQGTGAARDSTEAARHLWLSVKNQNGTALVVLAGLYAQGDGVAKDCDQAKILLDAAARQAKSHGQVLRVESARETLRTSGCE